MTHLADAGLVVLTIAQLLAIVLGVWVLTLKPRRLQTKLLGAFAILLGLQRAPANLLVIFDLVGAGSLLEPVLFQAAASFVDTAIYRTVSPITFGVALGLAWAVPEPLEDRRLLGTALAVGFAVSTGFSTLHFFNLSAGPVELGLHMVGTFFLQGALLAALVLLALRAHPSRGLSRDALTQVVLLTLAFAMFEGFTDGGDVVDLSRRLTTGPLGFLLFDVLDLAAWLSVAGLWFRNMIEAPVSSVRVHRTACLGILGLLAGGALFFVLSGSGTLSEVVLGLVRLSSVLLMAYGILRHDLAGLDEKVEFGVSKTTVAGIFVAVFFIVSEGAQALFADFAGNEFIGVIAAGALVFAISPLQRLADRFAAKAVPGGAQAGAGLETQYRREVQMALTDGEITPDEERRLAERADELGLSHAREREIRAEVEDAFDQEGSA